MPVRAFIAVLFVVAPTAYGAEPTADEAIHEALKVLTAKRAELSEQDAARIDLATQRLQELLSADKETRLARRVSPDQASATPQNLVNVTDFIDNTRRYRGKVIALPLAVRSTPLARGRRSLRDLVGGPVRFMSTAEDGNRLDMTIDLPAGITVPKAMFADWVVVTFRCSEGQLQRGNIALTVERPPQEASSQNDTAGR